MAKVQKAISRATKEKTTKSSICFILNDDVEYTDLSNFSSKKNKQQYQSIIKKQKQLDNTNEQLEQLRSKYHHATKTEQNSLSSQILNAEKSQENLILSIKNEIKELRKSENEQIKK